MHSAVIVLHELSTDSLILTKRSNKLRNHSGEICFPGGFWDVKDEHLYATALRELDEELGITQNRITLIKELRSDQTLGGIVIHPWLASIDIIHPYLLNPQEVTSLIQIPRLLVINQQNYKKLIIKKYGKEFESCQFVLGSEFIWGVTARIMKGLALVDF